MKTLHWQIHDLHRIIEYFAKDFGSGDNAEKVRVADYYIDPVRKAVVFCLSVEDGKPNPNL